MRRDQGVLILGCGYSGAWLAQRLAFSGRPVWGTTRHEARTSIIMSRGATAVLMDAQDPSPLRSLRGRIGAVVSCIPPYRDDSGRWRDPTPRLLEEIGGWSDLYSLLYVSATSVYGDHRGATVTERSPSLEPSPRGRARLEAERAVLQSGLPAKVIRPAGIYGPGRSQLHRLAARRYRLVGGGEALTNRIHVDDLAALYEAALFGGKPGAIYLASDHRPASQHEVVAFATSRYGLPQAARLCHEEARVRMTKDVYAMVTGSKRLDPTWTLDRLGVSLRYPDYEAGLEAIWQVQAPELRALVARSDTAPRPAPGAAG